MLDQFPVNLPMSMVSTNASPMHLVQTANFQLKKQQGPIIPQKIREKVASQLSSQENFDLPKYHTFGKLGHGEYATTETTGKAEHSASVEDVQEQTVQEPFQEKTALV